VVGIDVSSGVVAIGDLQDGDRAVALQLVEVPSPMMIITPC